MSKMIAAQRLIAFVKEYASLSGEDEAQLVKRRKELSEKILLIGETAAFFGEYDGMKQLHDAAEKLVGSDNSIGYHLNYMWDGIGGWIA